MSLPAERRAIFGRTHSAMYREESFDPIEGPDHITEIGHKAVGYLCVAIGIVLLAALAVERFA